MQKEELLNFKLDKTINERRRKRGMIIEIVAMNPKTFFDLVNSLWKQNLQNKLPISDLKYDTIRVLRSEDIKEGEFEIY